MKKEFLSGKKGKNLMGHIVLFLAASLTIVTMSISAFALDITPDTKGEWWATCRNMSLRSHSFDRPHSKATYLFGGECDEELSSTGKNTPYAVNADWNGTNKIATENFSVKFTWGPWGGQLLSGSIAYKCADDPWINMVDCTITGKAGVIFDAAQFLTFLLSSNKPISSAYITPAERQNLKTEWSHQPFLSTPQAPVILSPTPNQFFLVPATVTIKVQHDPNYNVAFEFQNASLVHKPNIPNLWGTEQVVPANLKTSGGVTTGSLTIDKPAKWRFRSQCVYPNAPWSDWTEFTVGPLQMSPVLQQQIGPGKLPK